PPRAHDSEHAASQRRATAPQRVLDARRPMARRERRREHVLGEAVTRKKTGRTESGRREFLGEGGERRRVNRLGAAAGDAPARQIESLEILVLDAPYAQVLRDVGGVA